jgi:uncharacterized protein (TIGR02246 family)
MMNTNTSLPRLVQINIVLVIVWMLAGCQSVESEEEARFRIEKDKESITRWFESWLKSTREGDLETVHGLIADDAVFLVPGNDVMKKIPFAKAVTFDPSTESAFQIETKSDIKQIEVFGDMAYMWSKTEVTILPKNGDPEMKLAGNSLTILKRNGAKWLMVKDANTIVPVKP